MLKKSLIFPQLYDKLTLSKKEVSLSKLQAEFIYFFLKETEITKTLEVGFCYGCSTAYIISATQSKHYAIDPHQELAWKNEGIKNLQGLDLYKYLILEEDFSHNALPKLIKEGVDIDFAFIDGDHKFDTIIIDFFYVDLLMNIGGYILLDDNWMPSTQLAIEWIRTNRSDYQEIELPANVESIPYRDNYSNLVMFQKVGLDERQWDHFKDFYPGELKNKYEL